MPLPGPLYSFKSYLTRELSDFTKSFRSSNFSSGLLSEFIVLQSSYQEEGVHLFPVIFLTENLRHLLLSLDGQNPILIGESRITPNAVHQIFKRCAPLASNQSWVIFVELKDLSFRYGVFRTDQHPLTATAFERLRRINDPNLSLIGLSRLGGTFVEIRNAQGECRYVNMGADQEKSAQPTEVIKTFMLAVTDNADENVRDSLASFYYRAGFEILHAQHGTLIAVIDDRQKLPEIFNDGITFRERIDVGAVVHSLYSGRDFLTGYQELSGLGELLRNMANIDGITVIDTAGAIVGYNYFVKPSALSAQSPNEILGGARRRAYDALCNYPGSEIRAVIYKSRDGALSVKESASFRHPLGASQVKLLTQSKGGGEPDAGSGAELPDIE